MIYGRELFGGLGEEICCGPAYIAMLPPNTQNVQVEPSGDVKLTQLVAGQDVFNQLGPTSWSDTYHDGYFGANSSFGKSGWRLEDANVSSAIGFRCVAGSVIGDENLAGYEKLALPANCIFGVADLKKRSPAVKVFVADSRQNHTTECDFAISFSYAVDRATVVGEAVHILNTPNPTTRFYSAPLVAKEAAASSFSQLKLDFADYDLKQQEVTFSSYCSHGYPVGSFYAISPFLWDNRDNNCVICSSVSVVSDDPILNLKIPHWHGTLENLEQWNAQEPQGKEAFYFSVYCSPYTGRGHFFIDDPAASVPEDSTASRYGMRGTTKGASFTFDHNLPNRPTEQQENYVVGAEIITPQDLSVYERGRDQGFDLLLNSVPRVLESTADSFVPHDTTNLLEPEPLLFQNFAGFPYTFMHLTGGTQPQCVADLLSEEVGGNAWASNDIAGLGHRVNSRYLADMSPGVVGTTYDANVVRFTGDYRHSTIPAPQDIESISVELAYSDPSKAENSNVGPSVSFLVQHTDFTGEEFACYNSLIGSYTLGKNRADGAWIGSNRYTSNDVGAASSYNINAMGDTSLILNDPSYTFSGNSFWYNSAFAKGVGYTIGTSWTATPQHRCIACHLLLEPKKWTRLNSYGSEQIARGHHVVESFDVSVFIYGSSSVLYVCDYGEINTYDRIPNNQSPWSIVHTANAGESARLTGLSYFGCNILLTSQEKADLLAGQPVELLLNHNAVNPVRAATTADATLTFTLTATLASA